MTACLATYVSRIMPNFIDYNIFQSLCWTIFATQVTLIKLTSIIAQLHPKALRRKFRAGNLTSRLLRVIFERPWIRTAFGAQLAAGVVAMGVIQAPVEIGLAHPSPEEYETVLDYSNSAPVTTVATFQNPAAVFNGVSQRFHPGHKGYDIRSPFGSAIKPISAGKVTSVIYGYTGYGNRVIIDHGNGLVSLYAHMNRMWVKDGQTVTNETKLGEVGLTGWTTGPHIHLEIYLYGIPINPRIFLDF